MERIPSFVVAALLVALAFPAMGAGSAGPLQRIVVGFTELPADAHEGGAYAGATIVRVDAALRFVAVETTDPSTLAARARLDARVRYVEADPLLPVVLFAPNDPLFASSVSYGPSRIEAPAAWDTTLGATATRVCIVDTGVRRTHEDIGNERYVGGHDVRNGDSDPDDEHGHGTFVTAIAIGKTNNGKGIAGIAAASWQHVRATDAFGSAHLSDLATAIRWCADAGAHVVSISLGSTSGTTALLDAVEHAWNAGALLVAAAGNDGCSPCVYEPAAYANVLAVGCTDETDALCALSNGGPELDLVAPGRAIVSAHKNADDAYAWRNGTSASAPHVAGVLALMKSHTPTLTNAGLRQRILDTALDLGEPGRDDLHGHGLVRAALALTNGAPSTPTLSCSPATIVTSRHVTCTLHSTDAEGSPLHYDLDWGDGTTTRLPAEGTLPSGTPASATRVFSTPGDRTLSARATEHTPGALASGARTLTLAIGANTPPAAPALACTPEPSTRDGNVTCALHAHDDSDGIAYELDWGDGTAPLRIPEMGHATPGTPHTARHAYARIGSFDITVRATDDATPALAGPTTTHAQDVRECRIIRAGVPILGALNLLHLHGVTSQHEAIPADCGSMEFTLTASGTLANIDVCWYAYDTPLACHQGPGDEQGRIPPGTTHAIVSLHTGAFASYELRAPPDV